MDKCGWNHLIWWLWLSYCPNLSRICPSQQGARPPTKPTSLFSLRYAPIPCCPVDNWRFVRIVEGLQSTLQTGVWRNGNKVTARIGSFCEASDGIQHLEAAWHKSVWLLPKFKGLQCRATIPFCLNSHCNPSINCTPRKHNTQCIINAQKREGKFVT